MHQEPAFADHRSRQQHRSGAEGAEEEDAARRHLPRDEAERPLRKAEREARARTRRGDPALSQAAAQARPARRPVAEVRLPDIRMPPKAAREGGLCVFSRPAYAIGASSRAREDVACALDLHIGAEHALEERKLLAAEPAAQPRGGADRAVVLDEE